MTTERVFAMARWRAFREARPRARDLVAFHAAHKYLVLAHSPAHYRRLGRLVATAGNTLTPDRLAAYGRLLMEALAVRATRGRHANVLRHLAGYFKRDLDRDGRAELAQVIDDYRRGLVPLVVPVTLVRHHVLRFGISYLADQVYLTHDRVGLENEPVVDAGCFTRRPPAKPVPVEALANELGT